MFYAGDSIIRRFRMSQGDVAEAASQAAAADLRDSTPETDSDCAKRARDASPEPPRKRRAVRVGVDPFAMDVYSLHRFLVGGARPDSPHAAWTALDAATHMYCTRAGYVAVQPRAGAALSDALPAAPGEVLLYRARTLADAGVAECAELVRAMSAAEFDALFLYNTWPDAIELLDDARAPVEAGDDAPPEMHVPGPAAAADD